jgi:hypothetical protein
VTRTGRPSAGDPMPVDASAAPGVLRPGSTGAARGSGGTSATVERRSDATCAPPAGAGDRVRMAVLLALAHAVDDALTAVLGALLPTPQARLTASTTTLAVLVAAFNVSSSRRSDPPSPHAAGRP